MSNWFRLQTEILSADAVAFEKTAELETEPQAGDIVINEIMWMGTTFNSNDEWIELRNMTDLEIDLGKWES